MNNADGPSALSEVPRLLWRAVQFARHRLLALDYDGTLAPFHGQRDAAVPLPRSAERLRHIASGSHARVAIVSGRPVAELNKLLGPVPATLLGEHGWEELHQDGTFEQHPLPATAEHDLREAERAAQGRGLGGKVERKRTGMVLHTRGAAKHVARDLENRAWALWRPWAAGALRLERTDGGLELRARGRDKGTALSMLISRQPEGTLAVYLGDDVSDEDAFEALGDSGFGVRVGQRERPTRASCTLPDCHAVSAFLDEWIRVVEHADAAPSPPTGAPRAGQAP